MSRRVVWLIPLLVLSGCHDAMGPAITGRWAAPGIEFRSTNGLVELTLPCAQPFHLSPLIRFTGEPIEFSGRVGDLGWSYAFTFRGRLSGDTLFATVSFPIPIPPGHAPVTVEHRMTGDGDPGFDRQGC